LGLDKKLGDEALRFSGTLSKKELQSKLLSEEAASHELVRRAGTTPNTITESAEWLNKVVMAERKLLADPRKSAATEIIQARFVAVAIILRNFPEEIEKSLLSVWEKVTFKIFGLGSGDGRTKVGDYVRLGHRIINEKLDADRISKDINAIGSSYRIKDILEDWDENAYEGWQKNLRYLLFKYDEYLAKESSEQINEMTWTKMRLNL